MAGNFADLTAVLTLDSARFSEEAARVKKELGETSALADLMSGKVSQSFRKQADAAEQSFFFSEPTGAGGTKSRDISRTV
ncbi:minor tail protein H [Escherichia coli SHECO002]|nr:minor tail protein H [Escherichia coli SHECO002]